MNILVDAMGGDNAPNEIVLGAIDAINEKTDFDVTLIGDKESIQNILNNNNCTSQRIKIIHASQKISGEDTPTEAIKTKKDSSLVIGMNLLKEKKGNALVSAGNTGALLAGALLIIGRMKGVIRPVIGAIIPSKDHEVLIVDAGLNSTVKVKSYPQYALFGSIYYSCLTGVENPKVGLINIGSEDNKGTPDIKEAHALLKKTKVNYVGNIEGNDIMDSKVHVTVCDGFTGNILLKFLEGTADFFFSNLKKIFKQNIFTKISALIVKKPLKKFINTLDPDIIGGAPILGIKELVIKSHGNSNRLTIKNVLIKAVNLSNRNVLEKIERSIEEL